MFLLKAAFDEHAEWRTSVEKAREFINDLRNFAQLMPGVERIIAEAGDAARWLIRADVPAIGAIRQVFSVARAVDLPALIEWVPAAHEKRNLLRYEVAFEKHGAM